MSWDSRAAPCTVPCRTGGTGLGWREESVGHQCQLSQALSHILVLCLLFLDKEDIQPVNSHKTRLEARRRQWEVATSVGSWPCSLASASPSPASPFSRRPRGCAFAAIGSPGTASPLRGKGCVTPSNVPAGWARRVPQGQGCCVETSICTGFGGTGQEPSFPTPDTLRSISTGATPEPASLPCRSTRRPGGDSNKPVARGIPARFYFHRCLKNKKENQFCLIYTKTEPKSRANANILLHHRAQLAAVAKGGVSGPCRRETQILGELERGDGRSGVAQTCKSHSVPGHLVFWAMRGWERTGRPRNAMHCDVGCDVRARPGALQAVGDTSAAPPFWNSEKWSWERPCELPPEACAPSFLSWSWEAAAQEHPVQPRAGAADPPASQLCPAGLWGIGNPD